MTEKYYTPDITEFHVGFEFEEFEQEQWVKATSDGSDIYHIDRYQIKDNKIRVKYLDQSDIESLGWSFEKKHPGLEQLQFTKDLGGPLDDLCLEYDLESHYLRISWYGDGDVTRFSGTIKNKSELNKLMQQLI